MTFSCRLLVLFSLASCIVFSACYSLNGISISQETESFFVEQFEVNTVESPPEVGQQFSELLKQKVNSNTRLAFVEQNADVTFRGAVVSFEVTPEAPNSENTSDLNRLTLRVSVDYVDTILEKNSYSQTFTDYEVFPAAQNLLDVQDDLLATLFDRMTEEAFQKAFSNW